jgi:sarcosine oxidase subunit beta
MIIIGGGIMGCATAFELSGRGARVALLEKKSLGAGSSGKSSAIIRQHYSNEVTARMAKYGLKAFQNFEQAIGGPAGFTPTGILLIATDKDVEGLAQNVSFLQQQGIKTELLYRDEIMHRWPYLSDDNLAAAAYEPEAGHVDPNLTLNSYAAAARRNGASIFLDTEVNKVRVRAGRVVGVDTHQGSFDAPLVLNCAGPWVRQVAKMAGSDLPVNPCRVQVAFFRRPDAAPDSHPIVADFPNAVYWRPETGKLTMVGLIDPSEADNVVDPDRFNERMDSDFPLVAGEALSARFPEMENSTVTGGYAALYAIAPDWHPVIDEVIPGSGFFVCAGFSGHGFKLAPAVGLMTADMLTGQETSGMHHQLFRLSRFAENDPVRGRYEYSIVG